MEYIIQSVKRVIFWIGEKSAWLNLWMVLLLCLDVFLRYFLGYSSNALLELEWHLFGLIFLFGSAYTLQMDKHVRVDVFYHALSDKRKSIIDLFGSVFLLIPWCMIAISTCYRYASNSFYIRENSPNPGGLPAWYVIKYAIVVCFVLLLLQSIVLIYEKIKILKK